MVKKVLLGMMAFATLFATSCTNELDPIESDNTASVSFKVETPTIASRAYSDGATATSLQYAVYDADGNILSDLTKTDATINGSTTVNLQLTTGNTYSVIFWAGAEGAPYTVDFGDKTMTVDYKGAVSNNEKLDAFYKYHTFTVNGAQTETIELKRPFAQLNIGTADYAASANAGYTPTQSAVTVNKIYNTLDLVKGEVSGETEVAFGLADIKKDETFPVAGNEYIAMNYLLVDADKEVVDVKFTYTDGNDAKTRTVGSVPVQRNYRTNIYGNLLTSEVDVNVVIKPEYDDPAFNLDNELGYYIEEGNYYIFNANGLKWVSEQVNTMEYYVNQAANIFDGKTVYLAADIDLNGEEFRPIGDYAFSRTSFNGVFDGKNHTISNFKITESVKWTEKVTEASYGLFGNVKGIIKNLTVKNATVNPEGGRYSAALVGRLHNGGTIENCHVINSSVTINHWQVGGLVGQNNNGNISDCSVVGSTITGKAAVGAIIGMDMANGEHTINNCVVSNTALVQNASFGESYDASYGLAVGLANASEIVLHLNDVVVENNTIKGETSNKLVGDAKAGAKIIIDGYIPVSTAEELTAAKAGDKITLLDDVTLSSELTLPAGVTLNGNGKQINGSIVAGGDLTFEGHTKVTTFSASYYNRIITIGESACLEVTGNGRVSLAYGNTFNITGAVADAKAADKANIQPSLIIPGGISITGGSDATFNVTNAYVQIGSTTSKNNAANGTFTLNIENSIAEFTDQLTFSEPTSGKNPTFKINVKNSVLTTGKKLILAAPNSNMVVDNSTITLGTNFRNSGKLELKNGSILTGATILFGENGGNDGETIVDNSTLTITATSEGHALDGKGKGSITIKNGATASIDYYKDMTINCDATSTFITKVQ